MSVINKYYHRALESVVKESFKNNKVVSILGARQCGKSTLVENLYPVIDSVSLKTEFMIAQAKTNPDSFVRGLSIPAFIDEAQRAPEIFGSIQEIADRNPFYSHIFVRFMVLPSLMIWVKPYIIEA